MNARFQNLPFKVSSVDGRNFVLLADVFYLSAGGRRYCLPAGASSDGASTPREVWPLLPPFGQYWPAAYLHDAAYRNTLLVWNGFPLAPGQAGRTDLPSGGWVRAALPKVNCDALLLEALESLGVGLVERRTIYEGVVAGGTGSFDRDRDENP
jgi:hypothetical protein